MARRALRKKPNVDLSHHLSKLEEIPLPWSEDSLFARAAPLEIEVGSGKGLFLANVAAAQPEMNFLGIEIEGKYAAYAAGKLASVNLKNVHLVHGDAQRFFVGWLPADCVSAVHVYFPDPWWKKRHRKRRVMNERFAAQIERVLATAGRLHFWTDVEEYFQVTLELLAQHTKLAGPFDVAELPPAHDLDYRTHFERRVRQAGEKVFRAEYRKTGPLDLRPARAGDVSPRSPSPSRGARPGCRE